MLLWFAGSAVRSWKGSAMGQYCSLLSSLQVSLTSIRRVHLVTHKTPLSHADDDNRAESLIEMRFTNSILYSNHTIRWLCILSCQNVSSESDKLITLIPLIFARHGGNGKAFHCSWVDQGRWQMASLISIGVSVAESNSIWMLFDICQSIRLKGIGLLSFKKQTPIWLWRCIQSQLKLQVKVAGVMKYLLNYWMATLGNVRIWWG